MNPMAEHERWEMEILDEMRRARALNHLIFGGGTMLRLCHQLPRYSVDLDFYLRELKKSFDDEFNSLCDVFSKIGLEITDTQAKHFTYLIELRKRRASRRLKIEIRKENKQAQFVETAIAFSSEAPELQVRLNACTLRQMWTNKIDSILNRKLIRDAYDIEFLLRRGAGDLGSLDLNTNGQLLKIVKGFSKRDFVNTLGPLLPPEERRRVTSTGFNFLEGELNSVLASK